jgi:DNA-binding NtrC family response regulator
MQAFRPVDYTAATLVGRGLKVLLATSQPENGIADKLSRLGGSVEVIEESYAALAAMIDDPQGYGLFVMDADTLGGIVEAMRIVTLLHANQPRLPVILISDSCGTQTFPEEVSEPIMLRAPVSPVSLRVGFEHALRDRLAWQAA